MMVVDDESLGRMSVSKMINELALDLEVIATARHGEEALALIRINKPHIVVTDMNMPVMNGREFLEKLYEQYGEIKVIVISGYSQFEFLKAALTYDACEYVLKPVSLPDLRNAMLKAVGAVREYSSRQQERRFSQDMLKLRREVFLQNVTSGRISNRSDIRRQAKELQLPEPESPCRLAVCMIRQFRDITERKFHGNADLFLFSVENILGEVLREAVPANNAPVPYKSDDRLRLCLLLPETPFDRDRIHGLLSNFHAAMKTMLDADVIAGISPICMQPDKLLEAFRSADGALLVNPLGADGLSIRWAELSAAESGETGLLSSFDLKAFGQALATGNGDAFRRLAEELARKAESRADLTIREAHRALRSVLETAASERPGIASSYPALFGAGALDALLDIGQLRAFLALAAEAIGGGPSRGPTDASRSVEEIVRYLDAHYFEDVSLIDVATRFHLDPSHLSKLFKSVTDENFIEYVTRRRMEKACELLRASDRKINEIAELVGYENQRYFSQVFKKFTGQTPSEYREAKS
ncbi:response regulator transcription factor [Cohnella zeiphila]|uniref:response regulator transcription factor n=1 Tax=Cohnella zeiphila TaxID=2761120 RepID=UPI0030807555